MRRIIMLAAALAASGCSETVVQQQAVVVLPPPAVIRAAPGVPASTLTEADIGALPRLGQTYTGAVPMLGRLIPLPDGSWQVVAQQRSTFQGYPPGAKVALLRRDGSQMTGMFEIAGNTLGRPSANGWPLNPICTSARQAGAVTMLGGDARLAVAGGNQDCVLVSFQATATWHDPRQAPTLQGVARALDHLGVVPPPIALLVAFGQTDGTNRLTEQLWLNPDLSAIPPDPEPRPAFNGWAAGRIAADPKRRAYRDGLLRWAQGWRGVARQVLTDQAVSVAPSVAEIR